MVCEGRQGHQGTDRQGLRRSPHGVTLVDKTGLALQSIVDQVHEIDANVDAISIASREQAQGIGEINRSINMLDKVTQQSAATVEEASAAASLLADGAHDLYSLVARFQTTALKSPKSSQQAGRAA